LFSVVLAAAIAFLVTVVLGSEYIAFLQTRKFGQFVREEGPETHLIKAGTPTMGGLVMLMGLLAALLVVARPNVATFATLLIVSAVAGIGLYDDWQKISKKGSEGLSVRFKFLLLTLTVVLADVLALRYVGVTQNVVVPGFDRNLVLGPGVVGIALFSLFLLLVIVGTTNAVNLTDGLDGLAAGSCAIVLLAYTAITITSGQEGLALLSACLVGASVGFLWFNSFPAAIFMGDTGSLGLGAAIGALAVMTQTEVLLIILGGIFVIEALSVAVQVLSFKMFRRRVLLMAPVHHHFEMLAWSETKIMLRFWIVAAVCAGIGYTLYQNSIG
jgi:phospho-N-acetylmuramoyl-pentapeptide-transferase